jgi:hypothetical protein
MNLLKKLSKGSSSKDEKDNLPRHRRKSTGEKGEPVIYSARGMARRSSLKDVKRKPSPTPAIFSEGEKISSFSLADHLRDKSVSSLNKCDSDDISNWSSEKSFLKPKSLPRRHSTKASPLPNVDVNTASSLARRRTLTEQPFLPPKKVLHSLSAPKPPSVLRLSSILKHNDSSSSADSADDPEDDGKYKKGVVWSAATSQTLILPGEYTEPFPTCDLVRNSSQQNKD